MHALKVLVNKALRQIGYYVTRVDSLPKDFTEDDVALWRKVAPYTMTSPGRVHSLCQSVEYVVKNGIQGDFVECGVWKGGCSMAMALTLMRLGDTSRRLYLYDTYDAGWPEADESDVTSEGVHASKLWTESLARGETPDTLFAKFSAVRDAMASTGYPMERVHMIRGKVEDTIPNEAPEEVAILRLDTDWYASTKHELVHLYPRLANLGVLVLDDYGYFLGARKAVDEYFAERKIPLYLQRIDDSGCRVAIKP